MFANPTTSLNQGAIDDLSWFVERSKPRQLRTMRNFAEAEIVLPNGPYQGEHFKCKRQPYSRFWFDAVDSGKWNRCVATGPVQSGKTLVGFVIPILYHLFEVNETVICGLPTLEMASDKWNVDLLPVIESSRFRHLLPRRGGGSRGGKVDAIRFGNGAMLKFMSGGGQDKKRAGFTSRVVVITETDGMDESSTTSREADKITQIEARTRAFGDKRRVYMECTVSTEAGRTWQEYTGGTCSRIVLKCPHCHGYLSPEREELSGWDAADNEIDARRLAAFFCKLCGEAWTEDQRRQSHDGALLVHRGQEVTETGEIVGDDPMTETLGFRWTAANNLFVTAGEVGKAEWRAKRSANEDNAEREMRQFMWALPHVPASWQTTTLDAEHILSRVVPIPRGVVPADAKTLTVGMDVGKYLIHWTCIGWQSNGSGHIVEYGRFDLASDQIGPERAILAGLKQFRETVETGWPQGKAFMKPDLVMIDAGYMNEAVREFCTESGPRYLPSLGRGVGQQYRQTYAKQKTTGATVRWVGEECHASQQPGESAWTVEANADFWKSWLHERLATPLGERGDMTLFDAQRNEHLSFAKHVTSERQIQEFVAGRGHVTRWECVSRNNHWLDSTAYACVAGHACGVQIIDPAAPVDTGPAVIHAGATRPDGRAWIPGA